MSCNPGYYEFFSGGGMARLGLGERWKCLFANDICEKKTRAYLNNFSTQVNLTIKDIRNVSVRDLPGQAHLSWASFPCQDLSLAGTRKGLKGDRSGTFWPFWDLMRQLAIEGRAAPLIVLENVVGAILSNNGEDFQAIIRALAEIGYRTGGLVMDSVHFTPQSRPRLFLVATRLKPEMIIGFQTKIPSARWHSKALIRSYHNLPDRLKENWVFWDLPEPPERKLRMADVIEENPKDVRWHSEPQTQKLLNLMSEPNLKKVRQAQAMNRLVIGTIYKRTRKDDKGNKVQRAEVRFDQISGCLRTPAGGSSRQIVIIVKKGLIRSRLLSPREAARLMGVSDGYKLPENYNEAYHLMGDGLVVPVVSWLEKNLLYPLAQTADRSLEKKREGLAHYPLRTSA